MPQWVNLRYLEKKNYRFGYQRMLNIFIEDRYSGQNGIEIGAVSITPVWLKANNVEKVY